MGETIGHIKVTSLDGLRWAELDAVVDTGATMTVLPMGKAAALGIAADRVMEVELGDGRIVQRGVAHAWIEWGGRRSINPVLIGEGTDACVIGVVTLETLGLGVDPVKRGLFFLPAIHHYRAAGIQRGLAVERSSS
ncbi:MAG: aspartyl protease [Elusimicrobia bacterium]|nr:aspartyl protease [Elusimicrobiota bacterium]MBI5882554.1 aspartyl protease [Elusimicrobiota bacterium]